MIIIYYDSSIKTALMVFLNMKNLISHYPHTLPFQWPPSSLPVLSQEALGSKISPLNI